MARRVLHLGPYQPVLEGALLREVRGVREADPLQPLVVLVPTALLRQHLKRTLALELGGHSGIRFVTVSELAREIAGRALRSEGLAEVPDAAATVLWRRAAGRLPADGFFGPIASSRGFPAALRATVRDLKEAGLTPEVLRRRATGANRLASKLRELASVWAEVERAQRQAGFHDALDLLREAGELAPASPAIEGAAAFVYGFYDLTRAQRRLAGGFLQGRAVAAAFVPYGPPDADGTFDYAGATVDFFQGMDLFPEDPDAPVASKPLPRIEVVAAPGEGREALEVVRAAARAPGRLHETGVVMRVAATQAPALDEAFESAGVPRTLERRASMDAAARAFRLLVEARMLDLPRPQVAEILTTLPVRWNALLPEEHRGAVAPALWDVMTREWGIVSGAAEWTARLDAGIGEIERVLVRAARDGDEEESRAATGESSRGGIAGRLSRARALRHVIAELAASVARIPLAGAWSTIAGALGAELERLFDFGKADADDDRWERLREALAEVARLDALTAGDAALGTGSLEETVELVEESLSGAKQKLGAFEGEGVLIADLMKARGLPFRTLVVPGMVEGVFPRVAHPDPLLSDAERRTLNRAFDAGDTPFEEDETSGTMSEADLGPDGPIPLKGASAREERLLFRLCLDAASERVVFTLPRLDPATARDRIPSWLLLRLLESGASGDAPGRSMTVERFAADPRVAWLTLDPAPATRAEAVTPIERDLADLSAALDPALDEGARAANAARVLARSPFGATVVASERARWGTRTFTEFDGWLEPPAAAPGEWIDALARAGFRGGREISATRLETWATCPYKYLLRYGLGLSPLEEPERQMTLEPTDRGELIHRALERFWRAESEANRLPLAESALGDALARLEEVATRVLEEFAASGVTGHAVLWRNARNEILGDLREAVRRSIADDRGWVPRAFELSFGETPPQDGEAAGPVRLAGEHGLSFRGRIDRVDVSSDGTRGRVVDYKSGKDRTPRGRARSADEPGLPFPIVFHGGQTLQRPIYVLAAKQRFPEVRQWEAVYDHCTQRGEFRRNAVPVEDETLGRLGALVAEIAADADAGRFPFIADLEKQCRWCDYREVCGPGHEVAFHAKEESDQLVRIRRRREDYP